MYNGLQFQPRDSELWERRLNAGVRSVLFHRRLWMWGSLMNIKQIIQQECGGNGRGKLPGKTELHPGALTYIL